MSVDALNCSATDRRAQVRDRELNGLDYLEVSDDQRTLSLRFLGKAPEIGTANVRIEGGRRVTGIEVLDVTPCLERDRELDDCVRILVDRPGDFSTYRLCLVEAGLGGRPGTEPLAGFDPRYACLDFSFKAGCPSDLDCGRTDPCPPPHLVEPDISYLAKDYAGFRQLILERLALIMPDWRERHVPDLGIALVELLAYVGDYLSYFQDAVATEAYLGTARQRISVRRHARLVDYVVHEGCNSRAWVCVETSTQLQLRRGDYYFLTGRPGAPPAIRQELLEDEDFRGAEIFEPLPDEDVDLNPFHNRIRLWTWGGEQCCLDEGATAATFLDEWEDPPADDETPYQGEKGGYDKPPPPPPERRRKLALRPGDVVVFEEILGPRTGQAADADPSHRQAVRLTRVSPGIDMAYDAPIVDVEWAAEDALAFPLCISSLAGEDCCLVEPVSVACGNVVLVDHGRRLGRCGGEEEPIDIPPAVVRPGKCEAPGTPADPVAVPGRVDPVLSRAPLTHAVPFPRTVDIARQQADALPGVLELVRARVTAMRRKAEDGSALSAEEIAELRVVFGPEAVAAVGIGTTRRRGATSTAADQAAGVGRLLGDEHRLLRSKRRRLEILGRRARAGYVLRSDAVAEIAEAFGPAASPGLSAGDPRFSGPASAGLVQPPREAVPAVWVRARPSVGAAATSWRSVPDLLASGPRDRHFAVETDNEGRAHLRFGDGVAGRALPPGGTIEVDYRIGSGVSGNVGAGAISCVVFCTTDQDSIVAVRNPMPAAGGLDPEPVADVKLLAPATFRHALERAVTAADYGTLAGRAPGIERAAAELRWTGSWYEVAIALDRLGGGESDLPLLRRVEESMHRSRRIGHDLRAVPARYVPVDLGLRVCVLPHHFRGHVKADVLEVLSNRRLADDRPAYFHPDARTFGDDVLLSGIVATVQAVPGVESVDVTRLQRLFHADEGELRTGVLPIRGFEIARLDNDPRFPENGVLSIEMGGGR